MTGHHQLVKDCLKHNALAQKQLYHAFAQQMLGVCYRYTKSLQDAEDVLQEGFVRAFKFLYQYNNDGNLGAWLRKIMVNTALNFLKKNRKYQNDLSFEDVDLVIVTTENPDEYLNEKELADLIRQLPTGYQTIFNLHAVEGFNHSEIGQMLGISDNTSRSQYMRARQLLIQWIKNSSGNKNVIYASK